MIEVEYTETLYDRETEYGVIGLPYRAKFEGLKAAATSPEGARQMIQYMLDRRALTEGTEGI